MDMDRAWLWIALGFVVLLLLALAAWRLLRGRRRLPPLEFDEQDGTDRLPLTPLEKRAWWGLLIGGATIAALLAVFLRAGTDFGDEATRRLAIAVFLGGMALYGALLVLTRRPRGGDVVPLDERDRLVLRLAPHVQLVAVIVTVTAWAIALTEAYWEEQAIPIVFPYLIALSSVIVAVVAQSAGVLFASWWYRTHGEG
ncbi:MAG: hypothetical protein HY812_01860 [Planctomycetes bacterium]|nr:hypothetical protein [Planctomycetota bacterium]